MAAHTFLSHCFFYVDHLPEQAIMRLGIVRRQFRADIFTSLIISPRLRGGFCVAFGELLRRFARVFTERLNKIALA